jgi:hypothetical protein
MTVTKADVGMPPGPRSALVRRLLRGVSSAAGRLCGRCGATGVGDIVPAEGQGTVASRPTRRRLSGKLGCACWSGSVEPSRRSDALAQVTVPLGPLPTGGAPRRPSASPTTLRACDSDPHPRGKAGVAGDPVGSRVVRWGAVGRICRCDGPSRPAGSRGLAGDRNQSMTAGQPSGRLALPQSESGQES